MMYSEQKITEEQSKELTLLISAMYYLHTKLTELTNEHSIGPNEPGFKEQFENQEHAKQIEQLDKAIQELYE